MELNEGSVEDANMRGTGTKGDGIGIEEVGVGELPRPDLISNSWILFVSASIVELERSASPSSNFAASIFFVHSQGL